jgi:hypothetical protein
MGLSQLAMEMENFVIFSREISMKVSVKISSEISLVSINVVKNANVIRRNISYNIVFRKFSNSMKLSKHGL